ncbi:MAG: hypothetical protein M9962_14095 [Oligoflexia bacterium]|nr:hypothetical protein [Oligoflexia bacterium]
MEGIKVRNLILLLIPFIWAIDSRAAVIEISAMLAYGKSDFSDGYKSVQRRYTGSIDFKFTPVSALQFEYTDSRTKVSYLTNVGTLLPYYTREAVTIEDKIYSFNWVQNLVSSKWVVQPYLVFGGGKMIRKYRKEYPEFGLSEQASQNVVTGVGGAGLRVFLTKNMAVKGEMKTYVPDFHFKKWKENQMMSVGVSWLF